MTNSANKPIPSVSVTYARNGISTKANALGMRPMQELSLIHISEPTRHG